MRLEDPTRGTKLGDKCALLAVGNGSVVSILSCHFCRGGGGLALSCVGRGNGVVGTGIGGNRCSRLKLGFTACLVSGGRSYLGGYIFYFVSRVPGNVERDLCFGSSSSHLSFLFNGCVALAGVARRRVSHVVGVRVDPVGVSIRAAGPSLHIGVVAGGGTNGILSVVGHFGSTNVGVGYRVILYPKCGSKSRLMEALASLATLSGTRYVTTMPINLAGCHSNLASLGPFSGRGTTGAVSVVGHFNSVYVRGCKDHEICTSSRFCVLTRHRVPGTSCCNSFLRLSGNINL